MFNNHLFSIAESKMTYCTPSRRCVLLIIGVTVTLCNAFTNPVRRLRPLSSATINNPLINEVSTASPAITVDEINDVAAQDSPKKEAPEPEFNWFKQWYPLTVVEYLDPEVPHKYQILGQDVVVWNDAPTESGLFGPLNKKKKGKNSEKGVWRAFIDECPHRKVPLSEGRIEGDGSLLCSYHGWRFDGEGDLMVIPQVSESELEKVKKNPKSSCNAFPTKVVEGVLWVWPSSNEDAILESELTAIKHAPILSDDEAWKGPWNIRELPYGHDFFIENVVDPAHVPVSHHGIVGNRYDITPSTISTKRELTKDGFSIESSEGGLTEFHAPSLVHISTSVGKNSKQYLELYSTPSRPGFCYHVGRMVIEGEKEDAALLRQFTLPLPTWLNHIMASFFLNQDALFLHHQERYLAKSNQYQTFEKEDDAKSYNKAVLPVNSDKGVVNFRNWIRFKAGGIIPYRNSKYLSMPEANNDVVFDVWNSHTKYCKVCQGALANLKKIRFAAFFVAGSLGVLRPFKSIVANFMTTLITTCIGLALNKLIGMFYRYEFSHAHND